MKTKLFLLFLALCLLAGILPAGAQSPEEFSSRRILSRCLEKNGADSPQAFLDGTLTELVGAGAENYVLALMGMGEPLDYHAYLKAARDKLDSPEGAALAVTTRQNLALMLRMGGADAADLQDAVQDTVGKQGLMSLIFGLHLANRGVTDGERSAGQIADLLYEKQLPDGGWALTGNFSDVDVTAMTLQALACMEGGADQEVLDSALRCLSEKQLADGGYQSYGVPNCESSAQVMIALCSLGVDPHTDPRFVKNQHSVADAVAAFETDGGFSHGLDGPVSLVATAQAFEAAVAYERFLSGASPLWLSQLPVAPGASVSAPESVPATDSPGEGFSYRVPLSAAVLLITALILLILFFRKKLRLANLILILLAAGILTAGIWLLDFRSPEDYYSPEAITPVGQVTLSIRCDTVDPSESDLIPENGVILAEITVDFAENETVYDVLTRAARDNRILLDADAGGYIRGIANIYEKQFGELSGWIYRVNGEEIRVGCREYPLSPGDRVEWLYTRRLGEDI